jgi:hypothetical protein
MGSTAQALLPIKVLLGCLFLDTATAARDGWRDKETKQKRAGKPALL